MQCDGNENAQILKNILIQTHAKTLTALAVTVNTTVNPGWPKNLRLKEVMIQGLPDQNLKYLLNLTPQLEKLHINWSDNFIVEEEHIDAMSRRMCNMLKVWSMQNINLKQIGFSGWFVHLPKVAQWIEDAYMFCSDKGNGKKDELHLELQFGSRFKTHNTWFVPILKKFGIFLSRIISALKIHEIKNYMVNCYFHGNNVFTIKENREKIEEIQMNFCKIRSNVIIFTINDRSKIQFIIYNKECTINGFKAKWMCNL